MSSRPAVVSCFVLAAASTAVWALVVARPELAHWFLPADVPASLLLTFLAADVVFFVVLPIVVGVGGLRGARWAWPLLCVQVGGLVYSSLWGWGLVTVTGEGWQGAALMTPPALLFGWFAWTLRPRTG